MAVAKMKATGFESVSALLKGRFTRVKIGYNTTAEWDDREHTTILIRFHGNPIVMLNDDGSVSFSLAGFPTVTTRGRVNQFIGSHSVYQRNWQQFLDASPIDDYGWYTVKDGV